MHLCVPILKWLNHRMYEKNLTVHIWHNMKVKWYLIFFTIWQPKELHKRLVAGPWSAKIPAVGVGSRSALADASHSRSCGPSNNYKQIQANCLRAPARPPKRSGSWFSLCGTRGGLVNQKGKSAFQRTGQIGIDASPGVRDGRGIGSGTTMRIEEAVFRTWIDL